MKRISLFGADFENSKKIVTNGEFALTAGMSNPIHMSLINRLFTLIVGFFFIGILIYGISIGIPELIGADGDIRYISLDAGRLISRISSFLKPVTLTFYLITLLGMIPVLWPKKRLSSQLWTYFPFYTSALVCCFISVFYLFSAAAYDGYTKFGLFIQIVVGVILFTWILFNSIRNLKLRLNDEEPKTILKIVISIVLGTIVILFPISLVYHQVNKLPVLWYFYILGLFLVAWFVIAGYYIAYMINVHIVQAYYIHKYPMEYKEYLGISDREWYSKRYYKKLVKSGQLEEE